MQQIAEMIGTFARIGYMRPAPGTWGSLASIPVAWALNELGGPIFVIVMTGIVFVAGLWATMEMTRGKADHDPSEIVIDEVVGQWIALWPIFIGAAAAGAPSTALWPGWVAAFVGFRLFDIWKPWIVGRFDARGDAMGVMLDDVAAGVFAAVLVLITAAFSHGVLM